MNANNCSVETGSCGFKYVNFGTGDLSPDDARAEALKYNQNFMRRNYPEEYKGKFMGNPRSRLTWEDWYYYNVGKHDEE